MNGYFCQGFNPAAVVPEPEEAHRGAVEAQVPRRHGSAADRDGAVLGEPRRIQRRGHRIDPDRGDRAADHLLCRGRGFADQFRPLAAMALGRRHAARRSQARHLDHGAALSAPEGALPEGRRRASRSDPQAGLALQGSGRSDAGRARQGDQRLRRSPTCPIRTTRPRRSCRRASRWSASPSCATTARRRAAAGSIPAASTRRATTWPAATTPIRTIPARSRNGRGRGRSTAASSTIARRRTSTASRGIRAAS